MNEFVQGQRWVVDSEPDLGLGLVVDIAVRTVTLFFPEVDIERMYSSSQAPLTRILFEPGDEIRDKEGQSARVEAVHIQSGVAIYETDDQRMLVETMLSGSTRLNQPFMRLMTGQLDKPGWFSFRRQFDAQMSSAWSTGLKGWLGARTTLIAHQLYVAKTACSMEHVRVLLADEVGLGKTIEAGLILSRLLTQERVSRVLIIVPDTLQVQWLVELVRKFNITPSLYDGEGYDFTAGLIHIVPHGVLLEQSESLITGEFDLVIIDEAHRISHASPDFEVLKVLAQLVPHIVQLSATPEQLGVESHFARLALLDSAKFSNFDEFVAREDKYVELSQSIFKLPEGRDELIHSHNLEAGSDQALINQLLDQHGVGRVMFRNVRKGISGFASRECVAHELAEGDSDATFEWLASWLKNNPKSKTLVICQDAQTVKNCELYLWEKHGLDVAIFIEEQSLIERDKSAAYFADMDYGARALLCSEIGSEGRNFQFSSDLVCLDLPDHPEVLEQRIGRLDRIGQKNTVKIHIPYFPSSDTAKKFAWYHRTLNCIEQLNPAASVIHDKYWDSETLQYSGDSEESIVEELQLLHEKISSGRDALLELNSCRQPDADILRDSVAEFEQATPKELIELASEYFQFHFEQTHTGIYSLLPSDKMLIPALIGLPDDGVELTFDRNIAGAREDLHFMTWDSPFVEGLWELLHNSELGSASVATLPSNQLPAGHCLLEVCFDINIQSPQRNECLPYLAQTSVRALVLDVGEQDLSGALPEALLAKKIEPLQKHVAREIVKSRKDVLGEWFKKSENFARKQMQKIIEGGAQECVSYYRDEVLRLTNMKKQNAFISEDDINALTAKSRLLESAFTEKATLRLSAIRLIVIAPV